MMTEYEYECNLQIVKNTCTFLQFISHSQIHRKGSGRKIFCQQIWIFIVSKRLMVIISPTRKKRLNASFNNQ